MERVPILLDCDTGVDDALAILYLAFSGSAEIIAAGSVHGNVRAPIAAANTLRVLELAGLGQVPVTVGAHRPMAQALQTAEWVHGQDGLGNTNPPAPQGRPTSETAAEQMIRLARERPGELTIVATAPLTNLGLALLLEPELPKLVRQVVLMGGAAASPGNVAPFAEANIWHDPEAAELVFTAGWPVTMVGLDVTMKARLEGEWLDRLGASNGPIGRFAWAILQHYFDLHEQWLGVRSCPLHDPLAAAIAVDRSLASYQDMPVHVELRGEHTRGATLCDRRGNLPVLPKPEGPPVAVAMEVDADRFRSRFLDAIAR